MQKLVEKIAYLLSHHRFVSNEVGIVQADRDYAREAITSVLSAVHDGEVELPGEVGRKDAPHNADVVLPMAIRRMVKEGARGFIAVRKEEGE